MTNLFDELIMGDLLLPNRVIMAPLTRCRASEGRVPNKMMAEYYAQRSSAGLIISEATSVTPMGVGYPDTPGIWSDKQIEGWKMVTSAVHNAGGRIILQLWHVGRISHSYFLDGAQPVAPSAIAAEGHVRLFDKSENYPIPRELKIEELPDIIKAYSKGAENAKLAGFDGVEIHGANGYLLDQFLQDGSNKRTDNYGGSIKNRARLLLEATDAAISVWGAGHVGVHIAPRCDMMSMGDSNPLDLFSYVAEELDKRKIAFIFARESLGEGNISSKLKTIFRGSYIINEGLTKETAENLLYDKKADAVSFGKLYIANPDLVERLDKGFPLNDPDLSTFYGGDFRGYTDYPYFK